MTPIQKTAQPHEKRNFIVFVVNQIFVRIGWIFKTETVVMPGFLDTHTPSGVIRGFLPLIARVGQSLPQFLIAHQVSKMPRKQAVFIGSAFGIMLPWLTLALTLGLTDFAGNVIVGFFLASYAMHWLMLGCNMLANGTLQGKLIRAERRGRILAYGNTIGCMLAIAAFWLVVPYWLREGNTNYAWIFGTTGGFFGLAAYAGLYFREPPDATVQESSPLLKFLGSGLMLVRRDRDFRRLAVVILLFYVVWLLFPHYTVFGMRRLGLAPGNFFTLIAVQNTINALSSGVMGNLADRRGNRFVLRMLIFIGALAPLVAIFISRLAIGADLYWIVYAFLGFIPVSNRVVINYTLEISPQEKHPQYLGVMSLFQALPLCASPLLGLLIDRLSFEPVFVFCSLITLWAVFLTFRLNEPRFAQNS